MIENTPERVIKMMFLSDSGGKSQALCLALSDASGAIHWFSGLGLEDQGEITTEKHRAAYLQRFAAKLIKTPYAPETTCKVHTLAVPTMEAIPANGK